MRTAAPRSASVWLRTLWLFLLLFGFTFGVGVAGHWLLQEVLGQKYVFGGLYRMHLYHMQHPLQYLGLVAFIYSALAAGWGARTRAVGSRRHWGMLGVLVATLLLSSLAGGVLWTFHDMQAGYFPPWGWRMVILENGAINGLITGWAIVGLSYPFNVLTIGIAYAGTQLLLKRHRRDKA